MIRELKFLPNFDKTIGRFEAWWLGDIIDRAPVSVSVKSSKPYRGPSKQHKTLRERWLDVEYVVDSAVARMESATYVGDNIPVYYPNVGPEVTATLLGCELDFSEHSSWSKPVVHEIDQWQRIIDMPLQWDNVYWQTIERMTDYALSICDRRFVVGITDLHPNYDILAALRDPQMLLMDMLDCPEVLERAAQRASEAYKEAFLRQYAKVSAYGFGSTTWANCYHEGTMYLPNCDFWCMVGPQMARQMILPHILDEMTVTERNLFHLDGPGALPHLDMLLELPNLQAIQWVFGAGHGPASRWIDVYKKIRAAGKSIQLTAETPQDAMAVLEATGTAGMWVCVGQGFDSVASAQAFIGDVAKARA